MKQGRGAIACSRTGLTTCVAMMAFQLSPALAQDSAGVKFHSRAEYLAERRKVEVAFPELTRALRVLHDWNGDPGRQGSGAPRGHP